MKTIPRSLTVAAAVAAVVATTIVVAATGTSAHATTRPTRAPLPAAASKA